MLEIIYNGESLTLQRILDLWLNGEHMHFDEDKAAILHTSISALLELQLHTAVVGLQNGYWVLANLIELCLAEPAVSRDASPVA